MKSGPFEVIFFLFFSIHLIIGQIIESANDQILKDTSGIVVNVIISTNLGKLRLTRTWIILVDGD